MLLALTVTTTASAHHSFAMFDSKKQITLSGVVKDFEWTNPHVFVQLLVKDDRGQVTEWSIEGASPNMLYRSGWSNKSFKAGDRVTIVINPLRDGTNGGYFVFSRLPDGRALGNLQSKPPG